MTFDWTIAFVLYIFWERFTITKDGELIQTKEMFQAIYVQSKEEGKDVKKVYPPIRDMDLECISDYFTHDHMNYPEPKCLQQQIIIYFFCR